MPNLMDSELVPALASELALPPANVAGALRLLDDANTIPFIARYRKEATGSMDEVALRTLRDRALYLRELDERRGTILSSIESQGALTDPLRAQIQAATTKQTLEDLYLPYRPKRRTRATMAREKGLGPLAAFLFGESPSDSDADAGVAAFVKNHEGEMDIEAAWAGCRDIQAETVADDAAVRSWIREHTWRNGALTSAVTQEYATRKTKFSDYYAYEEALPRIPAHRYLALRRGETEKVLRVSVTTAVEPILTHLGRLFAAESRGRMAEQWRLLLDDAYRRLIAPAIEVELRVQMKESADGVSIGMFSENLRNLLLQPPGGEQVVLGLDPGLRTGSKWVVIDATGRLLEHGTIYPLPPQNQVGQSAQILEHAIRSHRVERIAVGNGTGARELMTFVRQALKNAGLEARPTMVNEAGASVYSASDLAREEFPELDVTVRGAVSIARRWQDPLSELVKIDPKSIGVGQYQHDVNQTRLRQALDETVESCVNAVGVNVNTASWALLRYVSGLGPAQAKELVLFRDARGAFDSRDALQRVPRLGPKAYQQCAGFLRIPGAANPLDASAVHPEHYAIVQRMGDDLGIGVASLVGDESRIATIDPARYASDEIGLPTLQDILAELRKPGRDPRAAGKAVEFSDAVTEIKHLRTGMQLDGVVTNVTHFGAFVDLGVHQDGLVHISQLADRFVRDPAEIVKVGQAVRVTVLSVDTELKRIALSMKAVPDLSADPSGRGNRSTTAQTAGAGGRDRPRGGTHRPDKPRSASKAASPAKQRDTAASPSKPSAELGDVLGKFGDPSRR